MLLETALAMLARRPINDLDVSCVLDWLDKVRVGLWLGFLVLNKNIAQITPRFHIANRVATADRIRFVYKLSTNKPHINFVGTESPTFMHIPSSFALLINEYCLFNVSHFNLCDRRLGFPYAREAYYTKEMMIVANLVKGLERCLHPVMQIHSIPGCTKFFQPIFHLTDDADRKRLYDTKYVRDNSIDWQKGIGRVFQEVNGKAAAFPRDGTLAWIPSVRYHPLDLLPKINRQVYDFQIAVPMRAASLKQMAKPDRMSLQRNINLWRRVNGLVVDLTTSQCEKLRKEFGGSHTQSRPD